ncbi:protoporphyrinogen oxidase HemJ [Chamaesiphon minutus]|uniref:Protoporphyrinogen IX oxidase n=1 Tax=Chamaesiphon minutus (strain ATCC 27169 / PCC 6605) TaxID=1173020 RepID=K9UK43_CHAP6|nr:protoporphyrinogen oxidase HemJ [Chamaesiphon minutus]AFY95190.1 TIGR00701 family protein [Chamaesiphon minutus PCC 6605]
MAYQWFKSFHIIGFTVWFAGLFYLVRLFIYHVEANEKPEPARSILKEQYQIMEKRLYSIITTPGMLVTIAMAIGIISTEPGIIHQTWLHIKLSLVALLIGYHHYCKILMKKLAADKCKWSSQQLRGLNELPTLFLVAIVLLAIFKNNLPTDITGYLIVGLVVLMAATIQLYARKRRLDAEKLASNSSSTPELST